MELEELSETSRSSSEEDRLRKIPWEVLGSLLRKEQESWKEIRKGEDFLEKMRREREELKFLNDTPKEGPWKIEGEDFLEKMRREREELKFLNDTPKEGPWKIVRRNEDPSRDLRDLGLFQQEPLDYPAKELYLKKQSPGSSPSYYNTGIAEQKVLVATNHPTPEQREAKKKAEQLALTWGREKGLTYDTKHIKERYYMPGYPKEFIDWIHRTYRGKGITEYDVDKPYKQPLGLPNPKNVFEVWIGQKGFSDSDRGMLLKIKHDGLFDSFSSDSPEYVGEWKPPAGPLGGGWWPGKYK